MRRKLTRAQRVVHDSQRLLCAARCSRVAGPRRALDEVAAGTSPVPLVLPVRGLRHPVMEPDLWDATHPSPHGRRRTSGVCTTSWKWNVVRGLPTLRRLAPAFQSAAAEDVPSTAAPTLRRAMPLSRKKPSRS